jgi:hypothetical protein
VGKAKRAHHFAIARESVGTALRAFAHPTNIDKKGPGKTGAFRRPAPIKNQRE